MPNAVREKEIGFWSFAWIARLSFSSTGSACFAQSTPFIGAIVVERLIGASGEEHPRCDVDTHVMSSVRQIGVKQVVGFSVATQVELSDDGDAVECLRKLQINGLRDLGPLG